jgi:hypothetical protein
MRLPNSLAIRIGTITAAAAITVTGATTAASAATTAPTAASAASVRPAVHRIPTKLAIRNSAPKVHLKQVTAVIVGHLTAGKFNLRGQRVWLLRRGPNNTWHVVQSQLTDRWGRALFLVHLGKDPVSFRLGFRGTKNFAPSLSVLDVIK